MLPSIVANTHPARKKRYYDAAKVGVSGPTTHLPPSAACCGICHQQETRGLYRVPLKDGSVIDVGPDCLDGLLGINESNLDELRELVDPKFKAEKTLDRLRPSLK